VDELEWLKDLQEADAFTFYDDALTLDRKGIIEITNATSYAASCERSMHH